MLFFTVIAVWGRGIPATRLRYGPTASGGGVAAVSTVASAAAPAVPTSIFLTSQLAPHLLGPVAVAAGVFLTLLG